MASSMRGSKRTRLIIAILAALVVVGAVGYWYVALRDTSEPTASLDAIAADGTGGSAPEAGADGTWRVEPGSSVFVGYRVGETLLPARNRRTVSGRTPAVEGTMTIAGGTVTAAQVTADVTKLASDEALRDKVLETTALETARFGQVTFRLTEPLTLPGPPAPGAEVKVTATGTLEAHGVTRPFEMPLVARWSGDEITVATQGEGAPFQMADFGVELPKVPISEDDDHGTIEVQLRFVRS